MRFSGLAGAVLSALVSSTAASASYDPILPPSFPIAVRSPYLSAWLPGMLAENISAAVPQFWASGQPLNLGLMARVNGTSYALFSMPSTPAGAKPAVLEKAEYTATHTIFTLAADSMTFVLDFFSPVSPQNYLRQSMPFSYVTVSVAGASEPVQIYCDFDEGWTGQTGSTDSTFTQASGMMTYELNVRGAAQYSETNAMALWGTAVFAANSTDGSTTQIGPMAQVRGEFARNGSLSDRTGAFASGDVVAITQTIGGSDDRATFAVGYVREQAINYNGSPRTGYYRSQYPDLLDAVSYFLSDYDSAHAESQSLDSNLAAVSTESAGTNHSDIVTLSVRQSYGALDLTIPNDTLDTNDFMIFLREISSDGNVNTLDVLFPSFPIWYSMSPEYIRYTLEPVMKYLETGAWTQPFMIHDLGAHYPNATGYPVNNASEMMPVEESGNVLILAYAYTVATGDKTWAGQYKSILKTYADYLMTGGLNIAEQLSTDDGAGALANQTNLAIKAAVALNAFGKLFDMEEYSAAGREFAHQLYDQGLGTDEGRSHFTLEYGNSSTYSTAFNMYPDRLLNLSTFSHDAFQMQSNFYPSQRAQAGVPLDSRVDWTKTDWSIFCAASSTNASTSEMFIDDVWQFIAQNQTDNQVPFSDKWVVSDSQRNQVGASDSFRARPVVGGHFAIVAMNGPGSITG